jgi:hypothetical protein
MGVNIGPITLTYNPANNIVTNGMITNASYDVVSNGTNVLGSTVKTINYDTSSLNNQRFTFTSSGTFGISADSNALFDANKMVYSIGYTTAGSNLMKREPSVPLLTSLPINVSVSQYPLQGLWNSVYIYGIGIGPITLTYNVINKNYDVVSTIPIKQGLIRTISRNTDNPSSIYYTYQTVQSNGYIFDDSTTVVDPANNMIIRIGSNLIGSNFMQR